jgi:dUTP pyrophosphatase
MSKSKGNTNSTSRPILKVKLLNGSSKLPTQSRISDAGWDLYSDSYYLIKPNTHLLITTGISIQFPKGYWGQIEGRSGMAAKYGIFPIAGIIDSDYRGEIGIILVNSTKDSYTVNCGDRVAQLVLRQQIESQVELVEKFTGDTSRGEDGFGSSGR